MIVFEKYWIERNAEEMLKEAVVHYEERRKKEMCERMARNIIKHVPFVKTITPAETIYEVQLYVFTPERWRTFTEEVQKHVPYYLYRKITDQLFEQPNIETNEQQPDNKEPV